MSEKTAIDLIAYNNGFDDGKRTAEWAVEGLQKRAHNQTLQLRRLEASRTSIRDYNAYLRRLLKFCLPYVTDEKLKSAVENVVGGKPIEE